MTPETPTAAPSDELLVDPTNDHPVNSTRYGRSRLVIVSTALRIVATMVAMNLMLFVAAIPLLLLGFESGRSTDMIGHFVVFAAAIGLTILLRRGWEGDRACYLAIGWDGGRALRAALIAAAVVLVLRGGPTLLSVLTGARDFSAGPDPQLAISLFYVLTVSILLQGIPEELLWRGYLQTTLMSRLSVVTAAVWSAVGFGALHYLTLGAAATVAENLTKALTSIAFGLVMAALRVVTGSAWAAISYHAVHHIIWRTAGAFGLSDTGPVPAWLDMAQPVAELLLGAGLLWWWHSRSKRTAPAEAQVLVA